MSPGSPFCLVPYDLALMLLGHSLEAEVCGTGLIIFCELAFGVATVAGAASPEEVDPVAI